MSTWDGTTSAFEDAANWSADPVPGTAIEPITPTEVEAVEDAGASFSSNGAPSVTISKDVWIGSFSFANDAQEYTITVQHEEADPLFTELTFLGDGIVNDSGRTQRFIVKPRARIFFTDYSTIGNIEIITSGMAANPGEVVFRNQSKAGSSSSSSTFATITNNGGQTLFQSNSSAANAHIINNDSGDTEFLWTSDAGTAIIVNNAGGRTGFSVNSEAGSATITNNNGGKTEFSGESDADTAIITNEGGRTEFRDRSTAGRATIANTVSGHTEFRGSSSAGAATIITANNASTAFLGNSNGGQAQFITSTLGIVDFSGSSGPSGNKQLTAGFIGGTGNYLLGANQLTVVSNYSDPVPLSGMITGAGSLVKDGTHTFILSGANTYSGGTTILNGTLQIGSGGAAGTILGDVVNNSILAFNRNDAHSFSGKISGTGAVRQLGPGALTLGGNNTYSGGTHVHGTTIVAGSSSAFGTGAVDLVNGSTLRAGADNLALANAVKLTNPSTVDTQSNTLAISGVVSGAGALTKTGAGTLVLSGENTYTGATIVSAGTLRVNGTLGPGAVTLDPSATLGGSGTIGGSVTVGDGTIDPGNSPGTLTIGSLDLSSNSTLRFELGAPDVAGGASNDLINITQNLTLDGTLAVVDSGSFGLGKYRLFNYGGALENNGLILGSLPIGYNIHNFSIDLSDPGKVNLIVAAATGDQYWSGGDGTWNATNPNWTNENASLTTTWDGQTAIFRGTSGEVTVEGAQSFEAMRFEADGYEIEAGAAGSLVISGSQGDVRVNPGFTAKIDAPISGAGSLAKGGSGTLILSGHNSYQGGTLLQGGTVSVSADANLGAASGGLTFDGGTLLATNGFETTRQVTIGAHNGTIDVAAGELILSGSISGNGELIKEGAGTLHLKGSSTHSGGTSVGEGTLIAGADGALGAGPVTVGGPHSHLRIASVDVGRVAITNAGGGTVAFSGASTADETTIVNKEGGVVDLSAHNGVLAIGSLTGDGNVFLGANTLVLGRDGRDSILAGRLSDGGSNGGSGGSLLKAGKGTLTLTGDSTYTGETQVQAGKLTVNGSLASGVTVASGATIGGSGKIGALEAQGGATVAPGNSIGTLSVAGPVSFRRNSIYQVEVDAAGQSDRIEASGAATLSGGTVQVLAERGTYRPSTRYRILSAAGGVSGTFSKVKSNLAFLAPSLSYGSTDVVLTLLRKMDSSRVPLSFSSVAVSRNQYNTAKAVERLGPGNRLFNAVVGQSANGARQAFDALSGEAHASAVSTTFNGALRMQDMLLGRLQGAAPTQLEQRLEVVGSTGRANPDTAATIKGVSAPTFDPRRFTFWGEGFGSWGRMSSDGNAAGVSTSTGGFVLGAEAKLDETYTIGVAGGFTRTVFDVDGRMSSGSDETTFAAVYGSANWGAVNLRLGALYAWHDIDTTRRISFPGFADEASASYSGTALMAFGEIGYRFELGSVQIEPFVGASVMRLQTGDFTESGGAAALTHHGRAYDLGATTLGVRTEVRIGEDLPLKFKGMIGWRRAFGDIRPAALVAFSGGVSGFSVSGTPIDRNTLVAEAGLDWQINKDITLGVLYSGQIGSRAQDHAVKGNFTWRF